MEEIITGYTRNDELENNQIVDCIIISEPKFSSLVNSILEKENQENESLAKTLGVEFKQKFNNFQLGISYDVAVVNIIDGNDTINIWKDGFPKFNAITNIQVIHPSLMYKHKMSYWRQGYGTKVIHGLPKLIDLFPSALVVKDWATGLDANSSDNEIIKEREKERIQIWEKKVLPYWNSLSYDEIQVKYNAILSSVNGIVKSVDFSGLNYVLPVKGLKFRSCISKKSAGTYFNLKSFEFVNKRPVFYSNLNPEMDEALAEKIQQYLTDKIINEVLDEDIPF